MPEKKLEKKRKGGCIKILICMWEQLKVRMQ